MVWTYQAQAPIVAPPIAYAVGGKQYITVITGSGASGGGIFAAGNANFRTDYRMQRQVLTFAIGGRHRVPASSPPQIAPPVDPGYRADAALEQAGAMAYAMNGCLVCHGPGAVGGGSAPDLRVSAYNTDKAAFEAILIDGALVSAGMPQFASIKPETIEAIRQYLRASGQNIGKGGAPTVAPPSGIAH